MRVQCILVPGKEWDFPPNLEIGKTYTVIDEGESHMTSHGLQLRPWYELSEDPGICYAKCLFIPVSDIDEREMIREYKTEKV